VISDEAAAAALELVHAVFSSTAKSPITPEELPAKLEQILGLAETPGLWRRFASLPMRFSRAQPAGKKSPAFEVRWLNLCGFCLRPGLGFPGDDFRLEQARRVYSAGIQFASQVQNEIEWWIFWGPRGRRAINRNQQSDIYQRLAAFLMPRGAKKTAPQ